MNNNNQQQQTTNQNNVSANNLNETDPNISNISDFIITHDPLEHAVSPRQFEQQIGNEDQISRDFNWLDYQTDQSHYDHAEWRSSPVPRNLGNNIVQIHEYSGNVSYNSIITNESDSNTGYDLPINVSESSEYNDYDSIDSDTPIQRQPPAPPSTPIQSDDDE
uniref:Uncharacterized protein LOC113790923 n=1 Tax=Dermatophagoides pteronyssinus TaxID=6956 RepID=A0A6P6XU21_DERPT|nr:uncharacterized protein LOC113790923 [Dermatophagoides pteronyssinus]